MAPCDFFSDPYIQKELDWQEMCKQLNRMQWSSCWGIQKHRTQAASSKGRNSATSTQACETRFSWRWGFHWWFWYFLCNSNISLLLNSLQLQIPNWSRWQSVHKKQLTFLFYFMYLYNPGISRWYELGCELISGVKIWNTQFNLLHNKNKTDSSIYWNFCISVTTKVNLIQTIKFIIGCGIWEQFLTSSVMHMLNITAQQNI